MKYVFKANQPNIFLLVPVNCFPILVLVESGLNSLRFYILDITETWMADGKVEFRSKKVGGLRSMVSEERFPVWSRS